MTSLLQLLGSSGILVLIGLALALVTYKAGLRLFGYAIAGTNTLGMALDDVAGQRMFGGALVSIATVLTAVSALIMHKRKIGPFSQTTIS